MLCKLEHCNKSLTRKSAKGLCPSHYQRFRKNGEHFDKSPIGKKGSKHSQFGVSANQKICYKCSTVKDLNEFIELSPSTKASNPNLTHSAKCKKCSREARRSANAKRLFGEKGVQLDARRLAGEGCSVCGKVDQKLGIDHDHKCCPESGRSCGRCIRDLLCGNCNSVLGLCADNPDLIRDLANYVEKWNSILGGDALNVGR